MKQLLLIDGNSMLFRAYYGTQSRGLMLSKDGTVTNAVYGFSTMLTKAIELLKPDYILVAFDTGKKTFRHEMYESYKGTRKEVDEDLVSQFALVRDFLDSYPIPRIEVEGYEADDLIGTLSIQFNDIHVNILTSDRDMLQLISETTTVHLMKKGISDLKVMTPDSLLEETGLRANQIIDVKALQGDASDNIPGVPSIGEKTATKLIIEYGDLNTMYENKEALKGKAGEKIREFEEQARLSYELARIYTEVPHSITLESLKLKQPEHTLNAFYRKYDMNSLVKADDSLEVDVQTESISIVDFSREMVDSTLSIAFEMDKNNTVQGAVGFDGVNFWYLTLPEMLLSEDFKNLLMRQKPLICVQSKPVYRFMLEQQLEWNQTFEDVLLLAFITNSSITTLDILKDSLNLWKASNNDIEALCLLVKDVCEVFKNLKNKAHLDSVYNLYEDIEKPLVSVLARCEDTGILVDRKVLDDIADKTLARIEMLSAEIFGFAGRTFNINSPKQLGEVLFDDLGLPSGKKRSTSASVLETLVAYHPIIKPLLTYRKYQKLYSTYAVGLTKHIQKDSRIHTSFNQHATQTGRLSSSDPNLQNISVRDEETREIRKAFIASEGHKLLSVDYSQIELRVLSVLADEKAMMEAFNNDVDIHTDTAIKIFGVDNPTSLMRRQAKAVNFGIVYGISAYGLSNQIDASIEEASTFINRYNEIYPKILEYMNQQIIECETTGHVSTYFGRRRYINEIFDKNRAVKEFGKRAAMNAPIQGTAADIIKIAMVQCQKALEDNGFVSKMILQVHDELVFEVKDEELDAVREVIVQVMEHVVDWPIPLKVSVNVGKNWME